MANAKPRILFLDIETKPALRIVTAPGTRLPAHQGLDHRQVSMSGVRWLAVRQAGESNMTDPFLAQARRELADSKLWGRVPEKAILSGAWDRGQLVQDLLAKVPRPEQLDE